MIVVTYIKNITGFSQLISDYLSPHLNQNYEIRIVG